MANFYLDMQIPTRDQRNPSKLLSGIEEQNQEFLVFVPIRFPQNLQVMVLNTAL